MIVLSVGVTRSEPPVSCAFEGINCGLEAEVDCPRVTLPFMEVIDESPEGELCETRHCDLA